MKPLIIIIFIALVAVFAWDLRDGSFDMLSGSQYGELKKLAQDLPFQAQKPSYLPNGFKFLQKESLESISGNAAGIPQINLFYESAGGKNGLVIKQHDLARYEANVLSATSLPDLPAYFKKSRQMSEENRNGATIYLRVPQTKSQTVFGEQQYTGAAVLLTKDSVVEIGYYGDDPISQEELIKALLSLKPL